MGIFYTKLTTEEFIQKAKQKHGNKYDYSLAIYEGANKKVSIICPIHGLFEQRAHSHLIMGCKKCGQVNIEKDKNTFIKESLIKYNSKFDYSLVNYVNKRTKVKIICPIHGVINQTPISHLLSTHGCLKCSYLSRNASSKRSTSQFIKEANKKHNNKYDYSKVDYINRHTNVIIVCKTHGEFVQAAKHHLNGFGCPKCTGRYKENYNKHGIPLYETYNDRLISYGVSCRRYNEDLNILEVCCHFCNDWFIPSISNIHNKISSSTGKSSGENNLYCSEACKKACSTFKQVTWPKNYKPDKSREVQVELRNLRLEIDNNECQVCFTKENLQCHHYDGVELNPIESADLDRCITICKSCHKELHKIPGYTYQDFKRKSCKT